MWTQTEFSARVGIRLPIVQAGMAGGPTTPALVAAVCNAGGLGSIGAGYLSPDKLRAQIRAVRARTEYPFAVNLFVPEQKTSVTPELVREVNEMQHYLDAYRDRLGIIQSDSGSHALNDADIQEMMQSSFSDQLDVVVEEQVPVLQWTFGNLDATTIDTVKQHGILTMGTATTVREAVLLAESGVDTIVVQGAEAGGHRGTFAHPASSALIGLMALIPQVVDALNQRDFSTPVVAAGGIMDGRGIAAALCLGAEGVQMGTAFLTCAESGASKVHQETILSSESDETVLTTAFSGKMARGIRNRMTDEFAETALAIPPYPVQNTLTKDIRAASTTADNRDYVSLWAGQAASMSRTLPAVELVQKWVEEADALLRRLSD